MCHTMSSFQETIEMVMLELKWWLKKEGGWVAAARMHAKSRFFNITLQKTWCDNSPTATISHTMCSPQDTIGMVMLWIGMVVEEWGGMSLDVWRCTENHDRSKNTILRSIENTWQSTTTPHLSQQCATQCVPIMILLKLRCWGLEWWTRNEGGRV